jgi:hypothetical protein
MDGTVVSPEDTRVVANWQPFTPDLKPGWLPLLRPTREDRPAHGRAAVRQEIRVALLVIVAIWLLIR